MQFSIIVIVTWRHLSLRNQSSQTQIINHFLNLLNLILNPITPASQTIILQVQNLEAPMQLIHKPAYLQRSREIPKSHGVDCETA